MPTKALIVKAMVFLGVTYRCESWTIKKAEGWRTDAFKLWCWRRLFRISRTARRSNLVNPKGNQPWIFIGRTDAEAEAATLWPPDESWLTGKNPHADKDWRQRRRGGRGWDGYIASPNSMNMNLSNSGRQWRTEEPGMLQSTRSQSWTPMTNLEYINL